MEILQQPWPWYFSGFMIALVMFLLIFFGESFGVSSTFRHACSAFGAGKKNDFFNYDWKVQKWNLWFVFGVIFGGFISTQFLGANNYVVDISKETIQDLKSIGFTNFKGLLPAELFSIEALSKPLSWVILAVGGFLVGFGARYAGGCTSGHAISGLSNFQIQSLIAVVGFFIGGLVMTHLLFPIIFI